MMNQTYVVTGSPGSGKTTATKLLAKAGYHTTPEAARIILKEQPDLEGKALQDAIFSKQLEIEKGLEKKIQGDGSISFLDRGLLDGKGYANYFGCDFVDNYKQIVEQANYESTVFCLKPLPREYFVNDEQRKETYEEAVAIGLSLADAYRSEGYRVIELEPTTPQDRVEKILAYVNKVEHKKVA